MVGVLRGGREDGDNEDAESLGDVAELTCDGCEGVRDRVGCRVWRIGSGFVGLPGDL